MDSHCGIYVADTRNHLVRRFTPFGKGLDPLGEAAPSRGEGRNPDRAGLLARAATGAGVHALFIECHPEPRKAMSDAATQLPLSEVAGVIASVARIRAAMG